MRVLHIEDRRENRLLVRKVLEASGHAVDDAADGLVGVELVQHTRPDLVLVDINIPGLNGYEVVTRLRADDSLASTPIVAITAEGDREHALALGFDGFIPKPIRTAHFANQLQAFVDGHRELVAESCKVDHLIEHSRQVVDRLESRVRELERANAGLREVDRLKMEVLRNVSHELSTPMTPIVGYVRMLVQEELGEINDGQKRVLSRLESSTERLKALIDDLLTATRFATGETALDPSVAAPKDIILRAISRHDIHRHGRGMTIQVDGNISEPVVVDLNRMEDAISHLVGNAVKFGPQGGQVVVRTWIELLGDDDARNWALSVTDQGPGIPVEERERVCQPFYQSDGSATRKHGGAGLGLAIVQQTVRAHGGAMTISDADGSGVSVTIRVPMRPQK
jgi:signal transduction histidine kinase